MKKKLMLSGHQITISGGGASGITSPVVKTMETITEEDYNALGEKSPDTMYVILEVE